MFDPKIFVKLYAFGRKNWFDVVACPVMMARPIVFVTSNSKKVEEFVAILGKTFPCMVSWLFLHA
jgi:branched-subunit amino acid transport protein AzlD